MSRDGSGAAAGEAGGGVVAHPSRGLRWTGRGEVREVTLGPGCDRVLGLQACVTRPGVYDLSAALRVTAAPSQADAGEPALHPSISHVPQKPAAPCLLTVTGIKPS